MTYVAQEMQKDEYFRSRKTPLMIGGATTSRVHTAVKIDIADPEKSRPYIFVSTRQSETIADLLNKKG
jgi:5-methyltetrahydrofolate--homocysteine methyltransferase